jgi:hypothetical protein
MLGDHVIRQMGPPSVDGKSSLGDQTEESLFGFANEKDVNCGP